MVPATGIVGVGGEVQIGDVDKILVVGEGSRSAGGGGAVSVEGLLNQVAINGVGGELVVVAEGAATVPTETVEREEVVGVVLEGIHSPGAVGAVVCEVLVAVGNEINVVAVFFEARG